MYKKKKQNKDNNTIKTGNTCISYTHYVNHFVISPQRPHTSRTPPEIIWQLSAAAESRQECEPDKT